MISVDKELLQKYHRGECTREESEVIARWMDESDSQVSMADEKKMTEMESRIWNNIAPKDPSGLITNRVMIRRLISYGVAASLILAAGLAWIRKGGSVRDAEPVVYTLNSNAQKTIDVRGLNFTLANNSNAIVSTDLNNMQGDISFCGAVQITNNSGEDIQYVFESACKKSAYTRKQITFQSGQTYIAVHNFYKTDEVIVMKKENVIEFPDAISSDVISEFSI